MFLSAMKKSGLKPVMSLPMARCFSAVNLATIKRDDVLSNSDSKWLASYVQAVVKSGDQSGSHSDALDEYFRRNFRKLSSAQAIDVVNSLAENCTEPAACLDNRFWVWESLEQALHIEVTSLPEEDFQNTLKVFAMNYKGSQDFIDELEQRLFSTVDIGSR